MGTNESDLSQLLLLTAEHLDIPESYYRKATLRHRSVSEWLNRAASALVQFKPKVRPQGSFRYGTVNRPLDSRDEYDLDNVCLLSNLSVSDITQERLKAAYGAELRLYAQSQGMLAPPEEHSRCWRLHYADEVGFHLDSLPCLSDSPDAIEELNRLGVLDRFASTAIAITDKRHPHYRLISSAWLRSNPRGFARWFESRAALGREMTSGTGNTNHQVEDIPPYQWKTTLQRSIQLLKRHRDVMFRPAPSLAPISMIITNLSARAYSGERTLWSALEAIVNGMPAFINPISPRVPNPSLPSEDYADKWKSDPQLEKNFRLWLSTLSTDLVRLRAALETGTAAKMVEQIFDVSLTVDESRSLASRLPLTRKAAPAIVLSTAQKPWASDEGSR